MANKGYSQEYMANMLDISQQTYSLIEKKPEKSNLFRIQKIASLLDVKVSFLLNEEDAFNLYSFNQNGGSTSSYINEYVSQEQSGDYVDQLKSEIDFLRRMLGVKLNKQIDITK